MTRETLLISANCAIPENKNKPYFPELTYDIHTAQLICFLGARFSVLNQYLQLLAGLNPPEKGEVLFFLNNVEKHFPYIAYLNYNSRLLSVLNGIENVKLPALYHRLASRQEIERRAELLLNEIDYGANHSVLPAFMSNLQKRHLLIARAMMLNPKVLFIENPFAELELMEASILGDYLATLVNHKQITLIVSNAHLDFVEHYAQRIVYATEQKFEFFNQWQDFFEYKQHYRLKF